jgi:hypothetical protein
MKRVLVLALVVGMLGLGVAYSAEDPDSVDPDNEYCQVCNGDGCEVCNCTGNAYGGFYTNEGFVKGVCPEGK